MPVAVRRLSGSWRRKRNEHAKVNKGIAPLSMPATLDSGSEVPLANARMTEAEAQTAPLSAIHFDQSLMTIDAAKCGQGVVLTSPLLTEEEISEGSLIEPFEQRLALDKGFHVVHPCLASLRPAVQAFKAWLVRQASCRPDEAISATTCRLGRGSWNIGLDPEHVKRRSTGRIGGGDPATCACEVNDWQSVGISYTCSE